MSSLETLGDELHELSGLLAIVTANTQMLDQEITGPGEVREIIDDLKSAVERLPPVLERLRALRGQEAAGVEAAW
jgi:hypothetical protein